MINKIKKIFTGKELLEDLIPLVIMEIETSLLNEASQLVKFNEEIGACNIAGTDTVTCSEEALKIIKEANLAAENTLRDSFPKIPETHPQKLRIKI